MPDKGIPRGRWDRTAGLMLRFCQVRDRHDFEDQQRGRGGPVRPTPNRSAIPSLRELARGRSIRLLGWAFTVRTSPPRPRCFPASDSQITQVGDRHYFECSRQRLNPTDRPSRRSDYRRASGQCWTLQRPSAARAYRDVFTACLCRVQHWRDDRDRKKRKYRTGTLIGRKCGNYWTGSMVIGCEGV